MIKVGDKVQFVSKGTTYTGVVVKVRISTARGRRRKLLERVGEPIDTTVAEVSAKYRGKDAVFTCPVTRLAKVGSAGQKEREAARGVREEIKRSHRNVRDRRNEHRTNVSLERGLYDLKPGDTIQIEFCGYGRVKCEFLGITSANRVRFRDPFSDRVRSAAPAAVYVPESV